MIQFDIITIFPDAFESYFSQSIIKRALKKKLINIKIWNLRNFCDDKRKKTDDKPYGGGAGMVMKVEPIYKALKFLESRESVKKKDKKSKIILFSAKGKKFDQKTAKKFAKLDRLIMVCGHYEGVDERVAQYIADAEISVGDYVLTGGEIPAMILVDTLTRLIPGAIKKESLEEESFNEKFLEYPQYTRPEIFIPYSNGRDKVKNKKKTEWKVPKILLSGHHQKIQEWRKNHLKYVGLDAYDTRFCHFSFNWASCYVNRCIGLTEFLSGI